MAPIIRSFQTRWTHFAPALVMASTVCALLTATVFADTTTEAWRSSPFHGVPNAATGLPIPCRCRYQGRDVMLGTQVCMNMPNGTMLARCDLHLNNSTWVPMDIPCQLNSRNQFSPVPATAISG
jgi:hypothetical protein